MVAGAKVAPLVVIVGQTATGKSRIAMDLAKRFNGEIISADAWSVYKGFDIGTAKPSLSDRAEVRHHLVDVADPKDGFSAAIFKNLTMYAIDNIISRGKLPILVGGTGLYVDSVIYNYSFLPASDPSDRKKYNNMSIEELVAIITREKYSTEGIDLRNKRRLIRLIENKGHRPRADSLRASTLIMGTITSSGQLARNINNRTDKMLASGLVDEAKGLADTYGWDIEPMKGIGYKQFRPYFDNAKGLEEIREDIIKATIDLTKKQQTWLKRNKSIHWFDNSSYFVDYTTSSLNKMN